MPPDRSLARRLADIAATLGVPVTDFYGPPSCGRARGVELLRLWEAIPSEADRDRLLALARELAGRGVDAVEIAAG